MIEISKASINWMHRWANPPSLQVWTPRLPDRKEYIYEKRGTIYRAESQGIVSFFHYVKPGQGFGGQVFKLKMKDGSIVELKGPWHCGEQLVNKHFTPHCVATTIYETEGKFPTLGCWAAITLDLAEEACKMAGAYLIRQRTTTPSCLASLSSEQLSAGMDFRTGEGDEIFYVPSISPNIVKKPDRPSSEEKCKRS